MNIFRKLISIFCSFSIMHSTDAASYIVKSGDTLSRIAQKNFKGNVYGKYGSLNKLIGLNPHIHNVDLTFIGQVIELSKDKSSNKTLEKVSETSVPSLEQDYQTQELKEVKNELSAKEPLTEQTILRLTPIVGFRRVDSSIAGKNASALTSLSYGFNIDWQQRWDDNSKWRTSIGITAMSYKFKASENIIFNNENHTYSKLYFGGAYYYGPSKKHFIETTMGFDNEQVLTSTSQNTLKIESVLLPNFELNSRNNILNHKALSASIDAGLGLMLPSDAPIETSTSFNWHVGLGISYVKDWGTIRSGISYKNLSLGLKDGDQRTKDLGIILGVEFNL